MTLFFGTCLRLAVGAFLFFLLADAARRWARALAGREPRTGPGSAFDLPLTLGVVLAAEMSLSALILGALGRLDSPWWAGGTAVLLYAASRVAGGKRPAGAPARSWAVNVLDTARTDRFLLAAFWSVAVAGVLIFLRRLGAPPCSWDALTYHLNYPAHWLQAGRLETLHQPMGSPSSTYYPLCAEQIYWWGFRITGSDAWVAGAQVLPLLLGAAAVAGISRLFRAPAPQALWAALLWASTPLLLRQAFEAETDLWLSAWVLVSVFFALRSGYVAGPALSLLAAGLAVGTKYLGPAYLPVVAACALPAWKRLPAGAPRAVLLALPPALLLGGFAYVRNRVVTGNPVFPMHLDLGGVGDLPGLFSLAAYYRSRGDAPSELVPSLSSFLDGGVAALVVLGGAVLGFRLLVRRSTPWPGRSLGAALLAGITGFALVAPSWQIRFLLPVTGLAAVLALRGVKPRVWCAVVIGQAVLSLYPLAKEAFFYGLDFRFAGPIALILVLAALTRGRRGAGRFLKNPGVRWTGAVLLLGALASGTLAYEASRSASWERFWSEQRPRSKGFEAKEDLGDWARAWTALSRLTGEDGATVAYAGNNLPYPLRGPRLRNRVEFVSGRTECPDPVYDWGHGPCATAGPEAADLWLARLEARNVEYVVVFRGEGAPWPVETEWAERAGWPVQWDAAYAKVLSAPATSALAEAP